MLAAERRNIILTRIQGEKKVIVTELSKEFDVSEETIRRDLEKLSEEGHVTKTYGGAVLNEKSSIDSGADSPRGGRRRGRRTEESPGESLRREDPVDGGRGLRPQEVADPEFQI